LGVRALPLQVTWVRTPCLKENAGFTHSLGSNHQVVNISGRVTLRGKESVGGGETGFMSGEDKVRARRGQNATNRDPTLRSNDGPNLDSIVKEKSLNVSNDYVERNTHLVGGKIFGMDL
jgi:hypothetical protein